MISPWFFLWQDRGPDPGFIWIVGAQLVVLGLAWWWQRS